MAGKLASRSAQYPLVQEFAFNFNDWVYDTVSGAAVTLGSTPAASVDGAFPGLSGPAGNTITFDCMPLPVGAVVIGGELIVETAFTGPAAYTVSLGIAGATTSLLGGTSGAGVARTPLLLTSVLQSNASGDNVRMTVVYTAANATAGRLRFRVMYTIDGRANEVQIT